MLTEGDHDKMGGFAPEPKERLRFLCDLDLRTHTDADLDDDVSELQELALRLLQDIRNRDKEVERLERRNVELSVQSYNWMVAHDKLKAGEPYDLPTPMDAPKLQAETGSMLYKCEKI